MIPHPHLILPTIKQAVVELDGTIMALTEGHYDKVNAALMTELTAKAKAHKDLENMLERQIAAEAVVPPSLNVGDEDYEIDN